MKVDGEMLDRIDAEVGNARFYEPMRVDMGRIAATVRLTADEASALVAEAREAGRLREDVARLCAALEPFAEWLPCNHDRYDARNTFDIEPEIGHLRTAATVLADVRARDGGGND